jgi:hypothetical protein
MTRFFSPFGIAVLAIAAAGIGGCSTPNNQVTAISGLPCPDMPQASAGTGNVGGSIGGRMILGATPADNKPLCYAR